jgi:glutathione peroxidase
MNIKQNIKQNNKQNKKLLLLTAAALITSGTAVANLISTSAGPQAAMALEGNIYGFKAKALDGKEIGLDKYKGDVVLIVNTASECRFTPQYKGLEELNKKYAAKGLKVLGFPCNQFGAQEPGDSSQIEGFCHKNYGVSFQMFEKIDVNGDKADPIYRYLTDATDKQPIRWNFTKFLVDRKGNVVKRFDSKVTPEELDSDIAKLL